MEKPFPSLPGSQSSDTLTITFAHVRYLSVDFITESNEIGEKNGGGPIP